MKPLKAPKSYAQIAKECQAEIDRLTAQLAKTEKALKDTIRVYIVDDEEWDREAKMLKIFDRIMKEVE